MRTSDPSAPKRWVMFDISGSIFNEVGGLVKGWLKNPLNLSFFYWYFLLSVGLVLLQLLVVRPVLGYRALEIFNVASTGAGPPGSAIDLILKMLTGSIF